MREPMTLSAEEAKARVAKGAAHLDQVKPGWFNRIDTGTLTLVDSCRCIVGQLCPDQHHRAFDRMAASLGLVDRDAALCGVSLFGDYPAGVTAEFADAAWKPLQDAWIAEIAARKFPDVQIETADQGAAVPAR